MPYSVFAISAPKKPCITGGHLRVHSSISTPRRSHSAACLLVGIPFAQSCKSPARYALPESAPYFSASRFASSATPREWIYRFSGSVCLSFSLISVSIQIMLLYIFNHLVGEHIFYSFSVPNPSAYICRGNVYYRRVYRQYLAVKYAPCHTDFLF